VVELEAVDDYYFSSAFALMTTWHWTIKWINGGLSDFRIFERRIF